MKSLSNRSHLLAALLGVCGILLRTNSTALATITVTNLHDSGPGSLRQAIADAAPGDTIDFSVTGTITLASGELVIDEDLTINGPGATNLTVSGNNSNRVFNITNSAAEIRNLTIANGRASVAGGGVERYRYGVSIKWNPDSTELF